MRSPALLTDLYQLAMAQVSDPGILQIRRFRRDGRLLADALYDELMGFESFEIVAYYGSRSMCLPAGAEASDLLVPVLRRGRRLYDPPTPTVARELAASQPGQLNEEVRRLESPATYFVGQEPRLATLKKQLLGNIWEGEAVNFEKRAEP